MRESVDIEAQGTLWWKEIESITVSFNTNEFTLERYRLHPTLFASDRIREDKPFTATVEVDQDLR